MDSKIGDPVVALKPQLSTSSSNQEVQLFKAVEEGDLELVKELMQDTGPAIRNGRKNYTILHAAAANNQSEIVLYLLKMISPNVVDKDGQTPAHVAATEGHTAVLKLLLADEEINPDKRDHLERTYKDMLATTLFEAVLNGNKKKMETLLKLGADPDCHVGKQVNGIMSRELRVTTARQLALALHGEKYLAMFPKERNVNGKKTETPGKGSSSSTYFPLSEANSPIFAMKSAVIPKTDYDTCKMKSNPRGYVCHLNFKSFSGRPDLERQTSGPEVSCLSKCFEAMGHSGDVHNSLTAEEVRKTLTNFRNMEILNRFGCAIIVISSHSVNKEFFLTADMKLVRIDWVLNLFKDSDCPQLRNKPKLFIFNLHSGYYMQTVNVVQQQQQQRQQQQNLIRVEEPLRDIVCLFSESYDLNDSDTQHHSFINSLCRILSESNASKDIVDLYRELLQECTKGNYEHLPELQNFGFTEKFYLNPKRDSNPVW